MSHELNDMVVRYKETGEGWSELYDRVQEYAYKFPFRWTEWDEDKCSEFFVSFHPRISGIVHRFRPDYRFETYFITCLKWYIKTFTERKAVQEHYDEWAVDESIRTLKDRMNRDSENSEESKRIAADCPFPTDGRGRIRDEALRRRVVFIALLQAADMDEAMFSAVACITGVDTGWLCEKADQVRDIIAHKIRARDILRSRRNESWYRLDAAVRRLNRERVNESGRVGEWQDKVTVLRRRWQQINVRIRKMKIRPTYSDISRILNVPGGTVSFGIFWALKVWRRTRDAERRDGKDGEVMPDVPEVMDDRHREI